MGTSHFSLFWHNHLFKNPAQNLPDSEIWALWYFGITPYVNGAPLETVLSTISELQTPLHNHITLTVAVLFDFNRVDCWKLMFLAISIPKNHLLFNDSGLASWSTSHYRVSTGAAHRSQHGCPSLLKSVQQSGGIHKQWGSPCSSTNFSAASLLDSLELCLTPAPLVTIQLRWHAHPWIQGTRPHWEKKSPISSSLSLSLMPQPKTWGRLSSVWQASRWLPIVPWRAYRALTRHFSSDPCVLPRVNLPSSRRPWWQCLACASKELSINVCKVPLA